MSDSLAHRVPHAIRSSPALSLLVALAFPLAAGELTVGFGEADVTPELGKKPVYLAGFGQNRKATKVHDPIMARAVVLADGDDEDRARVGRRGRAVPPERRARPREAAGVQVRPRLRTHNHEGPDTLGLWGPSPFRAASIRTT